MITRAFRLGLVVGFLLAWLPISAQIPVLPDDLSGDPEARGFADLLFAQGMVALAARDYTAALPLFEKASEARREDATYRYFAGLCKLRLGRTGEAIDELRDTLPPAPNRVTEARIRQDLGDALYREGNLPAALRELQRSAALDDGDARTHFYLGLVLLAQGDSGGAIGEIERAVALDPTLAGDGAYYRGIAAYRQGDEAGSRGYFEQAMQSALDAGSVTSSRHWLDALERQDSTSLPPRFDVKIGVSVEHDDNPGQLNEDVFLPDVGSDERLVVTLRAAYQPLIRKEGWNVGLVLSTFASRHDEFDVADLNGVQGVVQASWGSDPLGYRTGPLGYARVPAGGRRFGVLLQAGSSYFDLDGDSFRRDHEIGASFVFQQPGFGKTQVEVSHDDLTFLDPATRPYSGHATMLRAGQQFDLGPGPERYVRVALARIANSTELRIPTGHPLDHDTTQLLAELAWPFSKRWIFLLYGSRQQDDYDDASRAFYGIADNREDTRTELIGKISLGLTKKSFLTFQHRWIDRDSDPLEVLSYRRQITSVTYTLFSR